MTFASLRAASTSSGVIAIGSGVAALEGMANTVNPSAAEPFITSRRLMGFRIVQTPWMPVVAMVRDARRCRAPHHEGLGKPHPEERALARVSKDGVRAPARQT